MSPKKTAGPDGTLPKLKTFYQFMTDNNLETLEIDEADWHVRLTRRGSAPAPVMVPTPMAGLTQASGTASASAPSQPAPGNALPAGATPVKSSMMGIFYRAASPSSPPFVKEGESVKAGQVVCMIEAMKVFNEIKTEFAGTVVKIIVENGKPVKSGQDLFFIQRA